MMQEGQGRCLNNHMLPLTPHVQAIERFDRAGGLTRGGAKGGEIMQADKYLCGVIHRIGIQFRSDPPDTAPFKR